MRPSSTIDRFRVIDGFDTTLDNMEKVPVNEKNRPLREIKLQSVSVRGPFPAESSLSQLSQVTVHANPIAEARKP